MNIYHLTIFALPQLTKIKHTNKNLLKLFTKNLRNLGSIRTGYNEAPAKQNKVCNRQMKQRRKFYVRVDLGPLMSRCLRKFTAHIINRQVANPEQGRILDFCLNLENNKQSRTFIANILNSNFET